MKKSRKVIIIVLACICGLLVFADLFVGAYMVRYALRPKNGIRDKEIAREVAYMYDYFHTGDWFRGLQARGLMKDTTIIDYSGKYKLQGYFCPAETPSKRTAIIAHGYTSSPLCMTHIARMFRDSLGFNVVIPTHFGHYRSEGNHAQMGWFDRLNFEKWSALGHEIFGDTLQVYHGISMGGATVMMASGDELPSYVKGIVEDCGYTDVWEEFAHVKKSMHLPDIILATADVMVKLRWGWGFREASSVKQLQKSTLPILFIHGDNDDFVPTEMVYRNYEAKTQGYKELWLAPGSRHGEAFRDHPAEYTAKVREFLNGHVY